MLDPPEGDRRQRATHEFPRCLGLHVVETRAELPQQRDLRCPLAIMQLLLDALNHRIAGDRNEQQPRRVRVLDGMIKPGPEHACELSLEIRRGGIKPPKRGGHELVPVALEQADAQILFGLEVAVQHRLRDPRSLDDLVHGGGRVAPPREEFGRGLLDQRAALASCKTGLLGCSHVLHVTEQYTEW